MSEPASLVLECQIAPDGLRDWLAAREPSALGWSDWAGLDVVIGAHEWAEIDRLTRTGSADFLRRLRELAERPADWAFAYDADSGMLRIARVLFGDEWRGIVATLAVLRRLGSFIAPGLNPGRILVHDWIYRQRGTMAAVALFPGGSSVLATEALDFDADALADRLLSPIRDAMAAGRPGPIRDDLEALSARS